MIEVVRPCFSPACRGEPYKQRIPCDLHPDTVDCTATCAERLSSSRSRCLFCGEWNEATPPEGDLYKMEGFPPVREEEGKARPSRPREERAGAGKGSSRRKKGRRGRPGRKRRRRAYPG